MLSSLEKLLYKKRVLYKLWFFSLGFGFGCCCCLMCVIYYTVDVCCCCFYCFGCWCVHLSLTFLCLCVFVPFLIALNFFWWLLMNYVCMSKIFIWLTSRCESVSVIFSFRSFSFDMNGFLRRKISITIIMSYYSYL